ncbi:DivIVA domain-containing protein [Thermomonospora umbrina]|uniref:DivIVA domain-containing protein n=1 Tax=Thermomonospora umbrina TaxID=111806 RepID=A0A3D9SGE2_9ACTN|nr:DivIVA domain-containing protein [Thermomonospora umbrina]REE94988.1 DivIVA domain-containing protein [Thermomonospora umbrina]
MPEFSVVLRGYDPQQVDDVVAQLEGTLGRAPLRGAPITLKHLGWTSFDVVMRGYDRFEVDGAMRRYRRELAALEGVALTDDEPDGGLDFILGGGGEADGLVGARAYGVPVADGGAVRPGGGPIVVPEELLDEVRHEHRLVVRWRGYDRAQVEHFLVRVWARLGHRSMDVYGLEPAPIENWELGAPMFDVVLRGYAVRTVDEVVERYRAALLGR